uniref:uncharacterized protein LOC124062051 isoform X4 n=1 Tax=Scatophagus argus TaxID=75038 RepID=UPI001ED86541|nr:uncharacterized protein LOC124062051 isoform X4 [Scatophagus argus]
MASVEEFLRAPSEELLESCSREQLVRIADYFSLEVGDKRMKDNIKSIIKANLVDRGMLGSKKQAVDPEVSQVDMSGCGEASFTFEQRRELLLLQTEMEKLALLRKEAEIKKMEMEERRLSFPAGTASAVSGLGRSTTSFDVVSNLRLLPQFNERDPDTFFSLFERVAESKEWSDPECTLLLQCVLTGRAQEAYSALTVAESKAYSTVKAAVLKAYELVPEAYRRKFRAWEKSTSQSHMEFARDLVTFFNRWCNSLKIDSYVALCDLIVLEQFKNSVPSHIAVYISEHKVKTATEAAALADEYVLTHRGDRVSRISEGGGMRRNPGRWEERPPQRPAPRMGLPFTLQVDASDVGAGAVLLQAGDDGMDRPVSFYSKKFNAYQLNYSVIEKETLALIWALQHFDVYVGSSIPLTVYTDHNPITFLNSVRCPNRRLMRWMLYLQAYCLDICHIRGSENIVADALSRAPLP